MKQLLYILSIVLVFAACKSNQSNDNTTAASDTPTTASKKEPLIYPKAHASFGLGYDDVLVYIDPTGDEVSWNLAPFPQLILVTDIHGDHLDIHSLEYFGHEHGKPMICPQAVYDKLPEHLQENAMVLNNGETVVEQGLTITAIPMYNITDGRLQFHPKGRGNGYVIEKDGHRTYISGDTEDIPEMRALENIDLAFVCMNLPYTMTPVAAASAVLEFKPKKVIPYHYRGNLDGKTVYFDIETFGNLVTTGNPDIEVVQKQWYPER